MTKRQEEYLKMIIEAYIEEGDPVGSKHLLTKYNLQTSPATIRNEMSALESEGMLEKAHTSSGRIPSLKGYDYYAHMTNKSENKDLIMELEKVFSHRKVSIDLTLDEAANVISDIAGMTLVTSSSDKDELMKSIQLTPINDQLATVVIVTSSGRVESKLIEFNENVSMNDVRIAIRLFKERLVDSRLEELPLKVEAMAPILAESINNYEAVIRAFVGKVFDFHNEIKNRVYGNSELVRRSDISREDLANLLDLIANKSIWESIENEADEDEKIKIDVRANNTSLISKRIKVGN
ncbi:MAG: heat-inducible transcriptional repressor HrcA, partial [Mycoplasmataceae bacterium]|nr:heat-inducible transcriptional repressor HrcA [Mycoplasmataceae bacterium]